MNMITSSVAARDIRSTFMNISALIIELPAFLALR